MNALVRKEIRLVLPAWIAAMVLAIFPVWLVWPGEHSLYTISQSPGIAVYTPFALGALLLGLASFAQELNFGTFSILLAQPVSRRHLWRVKTAVLAAAMVLVFVALCVSLRIRSESVIETLKATDLQNALHRPVTAAEVLSMLAGIRINILMESLLLGGICTLAAFSSGLWTNLLFRNTSAAFWFSLLVPLGLGLLADKLFGEVVGEMALIPVMVIYSLAGFLWAKKFFLHVQDTQWTGGLLSLPALLGSKTDSPAQTFVHNQKPLRALVRKEFQLHQVNLLIAALLLVSHVVVVIVRRVSADYFISHRSAAMIWESWPLLWLVMPLLIGGVAVAEERKLGTLENFLCLPTTRRREFAVKLFVALLLGFFLGGIMPLAVEWLGTLIGLSRNIFEMTMMLNWRIVSLVGELLVGSAGLTFVAFYASTLTRNLLQALGLAMVLSLFAFFIVAVATGIADGQLLGEGDAPLWRGRLIGLIGWPVILATVFALAFKNFKQLNPGSKVWLRNILTILAALVCSAGLATVIYHRAWEMWMPEEPEHRFSPWLLAAEYSQLQTNRFASWRVAPRLESSRPRVAVILPDGRLWLRQRHTVEETIQFNGNAFETFPSTGPWHTGFVQGSKWREVAVSESSTFAIQVDGSLWDLSDVQPGNNDHSTQLQRVGDGDNWKKISGSPGRNHFIGLKSDGTLWEWGTAFASSNKSELSKTSSTPRQIGSDSNWDAISNSRETSLAVKSDGSIWRWRSVPALTTNKSGTIKFTSEPEPWISFPGPKTKPATLSFDGNSLAAVAEDGSLWVGGSLSYGIVDERALGRTWHEMVRVGNNLDWQEVNCIGFGRLVATSHHGLWKWDSRQLWWRSSPYENFVIPPTLQSRYLNWVAISPCGNAFFALAADGKLCLWGNPDDNPDYDRYWPDSGNLLMPSRIKARTVASLLK